MTAMETIEMRPHQVRASDLIIGLIDRLGAAYLAGEVRTGKTLTVMDVIRRQGCRAVLFVTKKKAIKSIEKDRDALGLQEVVAVVNFEQVHKYAGVRYDMLVVDEAHCVGAYPKPSLRVRNLLAVSAERVVLMSGTPSPESMSQLYHQFALLRGCGPWTAYASFYKWASVFVDVRLKRVGTGQMVNDYSRAKETAVMEAIEPYMVRMTQEEAGINTPIQEQVHVVEMTERTQRLLRRMSRDRVIGSLKGRAIVADTGAALMSKLRQMASGTVIWESERLGKGSTIFDTSKVSYIKETFRGRVAILYTFDAEGRMLREAFGSRATDSPEVFNADDTSVYVGQVQASREGVNLMAADHLVFLGVDYAALSYIQARDRASYVGRTRANMVHWIIAKGSLEPMVLEVVRSKESYTIKHYEKHKAALGAGHTSEGH